MKQQSILLHIIKTANHSTIQLPIFEIITTQVLFKVKNIKNNKIYFDTMKQQYEFG